MLVVRKILADKIFELHTDDATGNPIVEEDWTGHISMVPRYQGYATDRLNPATYEDYCKIRATAIFGGVRIPIYVYDHSGVTFSTGAFTDRWDSGQCGWAWMTAEEVKRDFAGDKARAKKYLDDMVSILDAWATGEVYGYIVKAKDDEEIIDSCWGFINAGYESNRWDEFMADVADQAGCPEVKECAYNEID